MLDFRTLGTIDLRRQSGENSDSVHLQARRLTVPTRNISGRIRRSPQRCFRRVLSWLRMPAVPCRSVLLSGLCAVLGAGSVLGQTSSIAGRITSLGSGWPVVGALVEAHGPGEARSHAVLSNQEGRYRLSGLAPGLYVISVTAMGFGTQTADTVRVTSSGPATVSMSLEPIPIVLNPLTVTASRRVEKALEAPAHVTVIEEGEIDARPAPSVADHLRSATAVDMWTGGLQTTRVVTRGFNSVFSGSLHALTDNRIASLPSLRVNSLSAIPQTSDDIQRIEVVLGPGAALYGPNTAKGVLHIITKSPIDDPGSSLSVAGGERSVLHLTGRSAVRLSSRFGVKISGQYFKGHDWQYSDPVETAERKSVDDDFEAWARTQPVGLGEAELRRRADRIGARDPDAARYSLDARADWRPTPDLSLILTAGRTDAIKGIELSGVGATMGENWTYSYYQARATYGRWFAQGYVNANDAGSTFMLQNGAPVVDRSKLWVAQLQHSRSWRDLDLTYGGDLMVTRPETGGTIHGRYEGQDNYSEYGAYLQAKAALSPKLDLLLAGRWDRHTALNDDALSPRAALVLEPTPGQTFRLTFNRAFTTPTSIAQFIDMDAGPAPKLGPLGFRVHAYGSAKDGYRLVDGNGWPLGMRVPGRSGLVDVTSGNVFDAQLELLTERLRKDPATAGLVPLLQQLGPALKAGAAQLPVVAFDPATKTSAPVAGSVEDVPPIRASFSSVWEVGYQGLFGDRVLVAVDLWRSRESDGISPLLTQTPLFFLDPEQLTSFLNRNAAPQIVNALVQAGQSEFAARELADMLITRWAEIPGGVAGSPDVEVGGADLIVTNVNGGELSLWGFDLSARWLISDTWSASGTYSHASDDTFCLVDAGPAGCEKSLALNAPKDKLTASLAYHGPRNGFSGEVRVRHTGAFPVIASGYDPEDGYEPAVNRFTLLDLTLGSDVPGMRDTSVQLAITNLLDEDYRSFVGVPTVGRLALVRLRREF